jgi:hypothetical protein
MITHSPSPGIARVLAFALLSGLLISRELPSAEPAEDGTTEPTIFATNYQRSRSKQSLATVIAEFNAAQSKHPVGSKQAPLTKDEVITALNYEHLINDMPEKMDAIISRVIDDEELAPGTLLRFIGARTRFPDGSTTGLWVVTISFFLDDPAILTESPPRSADKYERYDVVVRANYHIKANGR